MNRPSHASCGSATNDFLAYGHHGIELNRAMERRDAERRQNQFTTTLQPVSRSYMVRRWLGDGMIQLGARLAGRTGTVPVGRRDLDTQTQIKLVTPV